MSSNWPDDERAPPAQEARDERLYPADTARRRSVAGITTVSFIVLVGAAAWLLAMLVR